MASELSMNGRKKIETIQKEFTQKFPYLTLVFLDQQRTALDISKSLSEVRQAKGADISIIASLKVNTLEKRFNESFGLIVEVAYKIDGKVVYTKDNVDKTLNELNKWCENNQCETFEFKKSLTGNTIKSVQEQLFEAIKNVFGDAEAKKINKDNYLDIYIPSVSPARGTHLFFNTSKNDIKIGYYTRDERFMSLVLLGASDEIDQASNGLRIKGNPTFTNVESAIQAALNFLGGILNDKTKVSKFTTEVIKADESINITDIIKAFVEKFGNDDLSSFLENYLESGKIVVLSISKTDLESAVNDDSDYSENVQIVGDVEMNDWKSLSKLIDKKEADWAKNEFTEENSNGIVLLYSEGGYVYAFSNSESNNEDNDEVDSGISFDLDELVDQFSSDFEEFDLTDESEIDLICQKIEEGKVLTNLLYVNEALSDKGFEVDNHQAYFFDSAVLVSDRELSGFLLVNMDGFYSNCMNEGELTALISWNGVTDLRYNESDDDCTIDIVTSQGELTIKKEGSHSLKVLYTFYKSVWEEINDKFSDEPFINWNEVWDMGITEIGFNFAEEYKNFELGEIVNDEENINANKEVQSNLLIIEDDKLRIENLNIFITELSNLSGSDLIECKFYTNEKSEMIYWLKFEINESIFEVTRTNWSKDSYWCSKISVKELLECLNNYLKNNDQEELVENYLSTDMLDYSFDGCGNADNGLYYEITDITPELDTVPDEFQDNNGDLDINELTNNLMPIYEELSEQSIGSPDYFDFSVNGKTYQIHLNSSSGTSHEDDNQINEDDEDDEIVSEEIVPAKKAVSNISPKNAVDLVKCVSILSFYYLSMNNNKEIYESFQSGFKKLFNEENFGNSDSEIVQEIKTYFTNNTIDQLIEEGELLGNETYDKKYATHNDFVRDISRYIRHIDLVDDEKFQLAYLRNFVELGNVLKNTTDSETEIKVQDRYLVVQIALSNWYNLNDLKPQIEQLLKKVKYNLPAGNLFKYSFTSDDLSLMEKAALFTYNIILMDEDGLEIKNKDIIRAKQVIAEVFGFDIKFEGMELKGSFNNSGKDDLGALIGGFGDNYCFDVMHFYNCHYSLDDFRNKCKDLFVESYNEINDFWGGYIEDRLEEIEFDAEDEREEKIVDQYNEARDEAESEE